jgi:two-component system sensor histidine kinase ChvG
MSLKKKLAPLFLLLLFVPVIGVYFSNELKNKMLEVQTEGSLATAKAISFAIGDRPGIFSDRNVKPFALDVGGIIEIPVLKFKPTIDGNVSEWGAASHASRSIQFGLDQSLGRSFSAQYRIGRSGNLIYISIEVDDPSDFKLFPDQNQDELSDQILLSSIDVDGRFRQFQIRPYRDGQLIAHPLNVNGLLQRDEMGRPIKERSIYGEVRSRAGGGYDVEFSVYRSVIGQSLGLGVMNVGEAVGQPTVSIIRTCESLSDSDLLGAVFSPTPEVDSVIKQLERADARIVVVDQNRNVVAIARNQQSHHQESDEHLHRSGVTWSKAIEAVLSPIIGLFVDMGPYSLPEIEENTVVLDDPNILNALEGLESVTLANPMMGHGQVIRAAYPVRVEDAVVGAVLVEETTNKSLKFRDEALVLVGTLVLIIFIFALIFFLVMGGHLRRLGRLAAETQEVTDAEGRIVKVIEGQTSDDEVGQLSKSLASFSERLSAYTQYLEQLSRRLSHELKTPIAVMRSSLELLGRSHIENDGRIYLSRAEGGLDRLNSLVRRMSEASDVEASLNSEELTELDVVQLIKHSVDEYRGVYGDREFDVSLPDHSLMIRGSTEALCQMLDKLVENAHDFSVNRSSIDVMVKAEKSMVLIQVSNEGPLIAEEKQKEIFDSMVSDRAAAPSSAERGHLGLGLYVVRLVAKFHGGTVSVNNRVDQSGVTFDIRLPMVN